MKDKYILKIGQQVFFMMPFIGGREIGTDNTCKTTLALKEFFSKGKGLASLKDT